MTKTEHYQLSQWDAADRVLRTEFNDNFDKIDAAIAAKGNCRIVTGSYVGTGTCGSSNKNTITFPKPPLLVFVAGDRSMWALQGNSKAHVAWSNSGGTIPVTWNECALSWYSDNVNVQMNIKDDVYRYVALISLE